MKGSKHITFGYNPGIRLAAYAIDRFYDLYDNPIINFFWDDCCDDIIFRLSKPYRETILHLFLDYIQEWPDESIESEISNLDGILLKAAFDQHKLMLNSCGISIDMDEPNYERLEVCSNCEKCEECEYLNQYVKHLSDKEVRARPIIIHTAFHVLFQNKTFLHDFNWEISKCLQDPRLISKYPDVFNENGRVRRCHWPSWLKRGILFRDKGVCVLCRTDLTGAMNLGIQYEIDHIIPISNFGNNDPTNLQALCSTCNLKKLNRSSETSIIDVPLWNLE